jgi:hypothetical protein
LKRNLYKEERQGTAAQKEYKSSRILSGRKRKTFGEMRNERHILYILFIILK